MPPKVDRFGNVVQEPNVDRFGNPVVGQMDSEGNVVPIGESTNTLPIELQDVGPQRIRNALQGLSFATADEMEAAVRALTTGESYQDAITDIRGKLQSSEENYPKTSTTANILGGLVPSAAAYMATRGKTPAPITSQQASRVFPNFAKESARILGIGAAETAAYNLGDKEGTIGERIVGTDDSGLVATQIEDATQAAQGGVTGLAINLGLKGAFRGVSGLIDVFRSIPSIRNISDDVVKNEVRRIAMENDISPDRAAEMLANGEVLSDIPEIAQELRALKAGGGIGFVDKRLDERATDKRVEAKSAVEKGLVKEGLAEGMNVNTAKIARASEAEMKQLTNEAYENIKPKKATPQLEDSMLDVLIRSDRAVQKVLSAFKSAKKVPFFRVTKEGDIELTGTPTQLDAEFLRRVLSDEADLLITKGGADTTIGNNLLAPLDDLRKLIDEDYPNVTTARASAAKGFDINDAFKNGKKFLSLGNRDYDEAEVVWQTLVETGNQEAIDAFRLGYLANIKSRMNSATKESFIRKLSDNGTPEGQLLQLVFPEDKYADALNKLGLSAQASASRSAVIGGSPTAGTQGRQKRQGTAVAETASVGALSARAGAGDVTAIAPLAQKLINTLSPSYMSDRQRRRMADILATENPELLNEALTKNTIPRALQVKIAQLMGIPAGVVSIEAGKQIGQNEEE
tara:strand:- start:422 stop:2482 length:2061 start_codon:yes stop_codon:yes gene_type:complete